jgi:uncharacterized membrane protein
MKVASIVGLILVVVGIVMLSYYMDPIRLMLRTFDPYKTNPAPRIVAGLALAGGIVLLFVTRQHD